MPMKCINHILVLAILLAVSLSGIGQNKKIDRLEMFYDQGNYKMVLRKSERLLRDDDYKKHPSVTVFHALAEYQMSSDNDKFSSSTAIYDYEKFLQLDSTFYYQGVYANYISDMKMGIANEIRELTEKGEDDKARIKYNSYARLFGQVADYEDLTNNEVVIDNSVADPKNVASSSLRKSVVDEAHKHIGTPYVYGGNTAKGFDCSGYIQYAFSKVGYSIPRTASAQAETYEKVKKSKARPGDLVFFGSSKSKITHVGIVVSEPGKPLVMIHASSSRGIMVSSIEDNSYWSPKYQFIVRIIEE
jgi:cell wall-associated NlpC family hydrolase